MPGLSSLMIANSGLRAAQAGLYVTGHNIANTETVGYTRQQAIQHDFFSNTIGVSKSGTMQVGLGTDISAIRQFRNTFLDITYRREASKAFFYDAKYGAGTEVETIIGETEGQYRMDLVLSNLWDALNELAADQSGIGARGTFVETAITFVDKVNNVSERITEYQENMNEQIRACVLDANRHIQTVYELNSLIAAAEASGANANDYRDARHLALDELSKILSITVKERANGMVDVYSEGNELIQGEVVNKLGLRYTAPNCNFVEPVIARTTEILPYDPLDRNAKSLFNYEVTVSPGNGNDYGLLKGLIIARGLLPANYSSANPVEPEVPAMIDPTPTYPKFTIADTTGLDPDYIKDYKAYLKKYKSYETALISYNRGGYLNHSAPIAPAPPDPNDTTLYPGNPSSIITDYDNFMAANDYAAYQSDYTAYRAAYDDPAYQQEIADYYFELAEYKRDVFNVTQCFIPKVQIDFDTLVHSIVTLINDTCSPYIDDGTGNMIKNPNAPFGSDGVSQYLEIFTRKTSDYAQRFDADGNLIPEDSSDYYSLYSMGNIQINPLLRIVQNYDMIPFSSSGDQSDNTLINDLIEKWKSGFISKSGEDPLSVNDFYRTFTTNMGVEVNEAKNYVETQSALVEQATMKRMQMSSVSLDEEMKNMMQYQHAYNAAGRILNVIDSMIDKLINGTGRVGI